MNFIDLSLYSFNFQEEETQTVNVVVERDEGDLAQRMVAYDVIPDGSRKFYGVPEVLLFPPGNRIDSVSYSCALDFNLFFIYL